MRTKLLNQRLRRVGKKGSRTRIQYQQERVRHVVELNQMPDVQMQVELDRHNVDQFVQACEPDHEKVDPTLPVACSPCGM